MPLHLLGKKSWNVYNPNNIAKVRRDEAAAQLREKEEQRRLDETDAEARLQKLRGVYEPDTGVKELQNRKDQDDTQRQRSSKKRRLDGEDDTDHDIHLAQSVQLLPASRQHSISINSTDTPLTDKDGHINLFPDTQALKAKGNDELIAEKAKRHQDLEDQYTMRLANATSKSNGPDRPWYTESSKNGLPDTGSTPKNAWGNEDSRRMAREKKRMDANDPLAAIKKGVKQLREADRHREEWRAQRERDLNEVEELARRHKRYRKRRHSGEESLDGFNLDEVYEKAKSDRRRGKRESKTGDQQHGHGSRHRNHHRVRSAA